MRAYFFTENPSISKTPNFGGPRVAPDQKNAKDTMFLEFNCIGVYFMSKCQIPKRKLIVWQISAHSDPDISGPTQKFIILPPRLFSPSPKLFKMVCHTPAGRKLG
jgi:hypothetical protein